jgi:hypothetical protein
VNKTFRAYGIAVAAAIGCLVLATSPTASALEGINSVDRSLSVMFLEDQLEVSFALMFGALPASRERKRMDQDRDGTIRADELAREQKRWQEQRPELFSVFLDDDPDPIGADLPVTVELGGKNSTSAESFVVQIGGKLQVGGGSHRIRLVPGREPPLLRKTDLTLDLGVDWDLVASFEGDRENKPPVQRVVFSGPQRSDPASRDADRTVTFVVSSKLPPLPNGHPRSPKKTRLAPIAAVVLGGGATILLLVWRRRRGRRI